MMSLLHPVSIGNVSLDGNIFLAPVAGYTDKAFRTLCVEAGADFSWTELISSEAVVRDNASSYAMISAAAIPSKYSVQLFGSRKEVMAEAAKIVLDKSTCCSIDINCGCPVPKVVKTGSGASLTRDADRLFEIARAVVEVCGDIPVTVKIRSGWDAEQITWQSAALAALNAGVSAITMHPRTRAQGYEGLADWNKLSALVEYVAEFNKEHSSSVKVFGSGDLWTPEDAKRMLETTKCDGVMFARGAMGNPFIFTQTKQLLTEGRYDEISDDVKVATGMKELRLLVEERGEERACLEMRKRFCSYTKGMRGGAELRSKLVHASSVAEYEQILKFFL